MTARSRTFVGIDSETGQYVQVTLIEDATDVVALEVATRSSVRDRWAVPDQLIEQV